MKKIKIILTAIIIFAAVIININIKSEAQEEYKLRKGAFIKVMARDEISTLTSDAEDEVRFINTSDMYVYKINAVPEDTIFYGTVEEVLEPVEGRDGALKIHVYKMITPDKKVYKINGHISGENGDYIGGKQTQPVYYRKVPHYNKPFKPFLQAAPLNVYEMGKHTQVKPGAELFMVLDEDVTLK